VEKDFYLERRGLASYFEKEWFDYYLKTNSEPVDLCFPKYDQSILYCPFNEKVSSLLVKIIEELDTKPSAFLEIGPALGRTFFETVRRLPSIQRAFLIEPSQNLALALNQLIKVGGVHSYPVLKGNHEFVERIFNSDQLKSICSHVDTTIVNLPFERTVDEAPTSDLVVCLNVLDQCDAPHELIEFLKKSTITKGVLLLACTYQWQKKYLGSNFVPITDLKEYFKDGWKVLEETNVAFSCRGNERYWQTFLPQVLILQKQ
jgi:SAM-dependent methyltransferase